MVPLVSELILVLVLFAGALIQGFLGFGLGIFAMAMLSLTHDLFYASGVVNLVALFFSFAMAWTLRRSIRWPLIAWIAPGAVIGIGIGLEALGRFEAQLLLRLLGFSIVGMSVWNLAQPTLAASTSRVTDVGVGLLSGILSGLFNTGGPPLVAHLYRRDDPPDVLKATLQVLFVITTTVRLPAAIAKQLLSAEMVWDAVLALPALLLGLVCGIRLSQRVRPDGFRRLSWVGLALLGLWILASA